MKILKLLTCGIVLSITIVGTTATTSTYWIYSHKNDDDGNKIQVPETIEIVKDGIWKGYSEDLMKFSQNNSFRIATQTESSSFGYGTAWSFTFRNTGNNIEWYLMTNYHVLRDSIQHNRNYNIQHGINSEDNEYMVKINTRSYLRDVILKSNYSQEYRNVFTQNDFILDNSSTNDIKMYYISDYSENNEISIFNNNLDLFSKSSTDYNKSYNLDIALIKIVMSKTLYENNNNFFSNIPDVLNHYNSLSLNEKNNIKYSNKTNTFIAGNPIAKSNNDENAPVYNDLYPQYIPNTNPFLQTTYNIFDLSQLNYKFNGPLYITKNYVDDYRLEPGASGSATYQISSNTDISYKEMYNNIPIGIYSLIYRNTVENVYREWACFIPFVTDTFNIFENVNNFLKSSYNNA